MVKEIEAKVAKVFGEDDASSSTQTTAAPQGTPEAPDRARAAQEQGFFDWECVDVIQQTRKGEVKISHDEECKKFFPDKFAKLKPSFDRENGTLTAANSTPLTDGASSVLLASEEWAKARGLPILAYLTPYSRTAAVDYVDGGEGLLMSPTYAVADMLDAAGLTLQDFDFYEIHEAFAAQVLCTLKAWESKKYCEEKLGRSEPLGSIDTTKLNVKGSSLAAGHPFAATGARILANAAKLLNEKGSGRCLISICAAGGQGVVAIVEK
mgnify:CR=1 FL=1